MPSLLTCLLPASVKGLTTERTEGSVAIFVSAATARVWVAESVTLPEVAVKTI